MESKDLKPIFNALYDTQCKLFKMRDVLRRVVAELGNDAIARVDGSDIDIDSGAWHLTWIEFDGNTSMVKYFSIIYEWQDLLTWKLTIFNPQEPNDRGYIVNEGKYGDRKFNKLLKEFGLKDATT